MGAVTALAVLAVLIMLAWFLYTKVKSNQAAKSTG